MVRKSSVLRSNRSIRWETGCCGISIRAGVEFAIKTKAGETTYVRMVVVMGTWRGAGRLLQVDPEDAQKVIGKLKPLHE